mmetsp:Transcript_16034/g.52235  ORF Transcript_16034/g.52235 Transcript_16034/m.52235 type:complete len:300 (+) Transcript_16034:36-935(+)
MRTASRSRSTRSSRKSSVPMPLPASGSSSCSASGMARRRLPSNSSGVAPSPSPAAASAPKRPPSGCSGSMVWLSSCTWAAHMPHNVAWQQLQRKMPCWDTSPELSHVHSTEQHCARPARPTNGPKLKRLCSAPLGAAAGSGAADGGCGGAASASSAEDSPTSSLAAVAAAAAACGAMQKALSMQAETTGSDMAFPARSESCTSDSPPRSSWSAGMPERRSFSKPEISRPRLKWYIWPPGVRHPVMPGLLTVSQRCGFCDRSTSALWCSKSTPASAFLMALISAWSSECCDQKPHTSCIQ